MSLYRIFSFTVFKSLNNHDRSIQITLCIMCFLIDFQRVVWEPPSWWIYKCVAWITVLLAEVIVYCSARDFCINVKFWFYVKRILLFDFQIHMWQNLCCLLFFVYLLSFLSVLLMSTWGPATRWNLSSVRPLTPCLVRPFKSFCISSNTQNWREPRLAWTIYSPLKLLGDCLLYNLPGIFIINLVWHKE